MRTAFAIARHFSGTSLRAIAPRAAAISLASVWYSKLTSLCGEAPSTAVEALTSRYAETDGRWRPWGRGLLNIEGSWVCPLYRRARRILDAPPDRQQRTRSSVLRRRKQLRVPDLDLLRDELVQRVRLRHRRIQRRVLRLQPRLGVVEARLHRVLVLLVRVDLGLERRGLAGQRAAGVEQRVGPVRELLGEPVVRGRRGVEVAERLGDVGQAQERVGQLGVVDLQRAVLLQLNPERAER